MLRLRRAYETLHRAAALMHRGGKAARYMDLLAVRRPRPERRSGFPCERFHEPLEEQRLIRVQHFALFLE